MNGPRAVVAVVACVGALLSTGCPARSRLPRGAQEIIVPAPPTSTPVGLERIVKLGSESPILDPRCSCSIDVPAGWVAFQVDGQRGNGIRLQRGADPPMTVDIWFNAEVPEDAAAFFDRGPYLGPAGRLDNVAVWTLKDLDRPDGRRFGALLQQGRRSVVVEGWIAEEEFEAGKRAFDTIVAGILLDLEEAP